MTTVFVTDSSFAEHTLDGHPEHAGRLAAVVDVFEKQGLTGRLLAVEAQPARSDDLSAVHSARYLRLLEKTAGRSVMFGADTYAVPRSYEIARLAAGAGLRVVDAVMTGQAENGIAAVRPPGHHATVEGAMGFCLLNNAAIATRYAQRRHSVERVAIVDYDVHHGNGTQDIFYDDGTVLYISIHQSPLYPGTGAVREVGRGTGRGATLNIPLPPGAGDTSYARVWDALVVPVLRRFAPQLIVVSAGFDAHWIDPLANMQLTLSGYDRLARSLVEVAAHDAESRLVCIMEGGYDLVALGYGWANIAYALVGDDKFLDPLGASSLPEEPRIDHIIDRLRQLHNLS